MLAAVNANTGEIAWQVPLYALPDAANRLLAQ
jgi:hypothetical protein